MHFIIGWRFLLSYRQVGAAEETGMFAENTPQPALSNSSACSSDGREDAFLMLPGLVLPRLRGELNGNRQMGDGLGRLRRKLDDELAAPVRTFGKFATGDGGNL